MRDIAKELRRWLAEGNAIALATVIKTWGSSPRKAGAHMGITQEGEIAGSVSGGCVESAVVEVGLEVLSTGIPQLLHFGVADETAWEVGLACGGEIDVFVEPLSPDKIKFILSHLSDNHTVSWATVVKGENSILGKSIIRSNKKVFSEFNVETKNIELEALPHFEKQFSGGNQTQTISLELSGSEIQIDLFFNTILVPSTLVIIGGNHISIALSKLAKILNYNIILIDPRRVFGNKDRFPEIDQLFTLWPEEAFENIDLSASTALVSLTHDPKIDDFALATAVNSEAFYVGALGSRKTHAKRLIRLNDSGVDEEQTKKINGPIGLDIGAISPEEIALSIMAEITAAYHKKLSQ